MTEERHDPKREKIKQMFREISSSPDLMDKLIAEEDQDARKNILEREGILEPGEDGFTRQEVRQEITRLLTEEGPPGRPGDVTEERPVEWVGAIATAAAGAAAAACID